MPAVGTADVPEPGSELGSWLRLQREAHGWSKRDMARRLIQAGRAAGDNGMPGLDNMYRYVHRWEQGDNEPTERYVLCYCAVLEIPPGQFGSAGAKPAALAEENAANSLSVSPDGLSLSLSYPSGRLVIRISGLVAEIEAESEAGLSPVTDGLVLQMDPGSPPQPGGRTCTCCGSRLSRYNKETVCQACMSASTRRREQPQERHAKYGTRA